MAPNSGLPERGEMFPTDGGTFPPDPALAEDTDSPQMTHALDFASEFGSLPLTSVKDYDEYTVDYSSVAASSSSSSHLPPGLKDAEDLEPAPATTEVLGSTYGNVVIQLTPSTANNKGKGKGKATTNVDGALRFRVDEWTKEVVPITESGEDVVRVYMSDAWSAYFDTISLESTSNRNTDGDGLLLHRFDNRPGFDNHHLGFDNHRPGFDNHHLGFHRHRLGLDNKLHEPDNNPLRLKRRKAQAAAPPVFVLVRFDKFMDLPLELRQPIYEEVLVSDEPVRPHLCQTNSSGAIKFCDKSQSTHDAMSRRLAITCVSKQVRAESLPVFYDGNTFSWTDDTLTYLERLSHLGRFHMVHHVTFPVYFYKDGYAIRALRDIQMFIKKQEDYENKLQPKETAQEFDWCSAKYSTLARHPLHLASGVGWVAPFLIMRKLSKAFQNSDDEYERQLVLYIPSKKLFDVFKVLEWFRMVAHGLGLKLKFVEGADCKWIDDYSGISFEWVQKYQKKDPTEQCNSQARNAAQILERAKERFPNINAQYGPNALTYYRRPCNKYGPCNDNIEWFKLNYYDHV
jgi:hypothetical protein